MPTHKENKFLSYSSQQMYNLVSDVGSYPEFLPWCAAARVNSIIDEGSDRVMSADLVISFKVFRERFCSEVRLSPKEYFIQTKYIDGPFKYMNSTWQFNDCPDGCTVTFFVDFEFKSIILQGLIGLVFHDAMQRIVRAFEARADILYR
ncbi:MAG: type II toxin-antitoxin system RatA family toxin [Planktomarina sp.]|nr:type II toxin-antitoxin system RatA family toxin [Planktomarina sp.]